MATRDQYYDNDETIYYDEDRQYFTPDDYFGTTSHSNAIQTGPGRREAYNYDDARIIQRDRIPDVDTIARPPRQYRHNTDGRIAVPERASRAPRLAQTSSQRAVQRQQPERHTEPQRRISQPVDRRDALAKIAGAGLLTIVAGAVGGSWIASEADKVGNQFQLGNARACTMELTCGHNDKDHKTLLLFIFMLDRLFMFELPGGDFSKIKTNVTATLESHNIIADPSDINILPSAVAVDGDKFEIHALLRWKPVGVFAKSTDINFLFVDGGGFFRMPVVKK